MQKNQIKPVQIRSKAKAYILINRENNEILSQKNSSQQLEIASLTKMVTLQVSLDLQKKFKLSNQFEVHVSKEAASIKGTSAQLYQGDILTLQELHFGLMLPSGNDAAHCLAENLGMIYYLHDKYSNNGEESIKNQKIKTLLDNIQKKQGLNITEFSGSLSRLGYMYFIRMMNKYVREDLNLTNTYFINSHGMTLNENISTASDMAQISMNILDSEYIQDIVNTVIFRAFLYNANQGERTMEWQNTNKLLYKEWAGFKGVKTGINRNAKGCLSTLFQKYDSDIKTYFNLIVVVLGSSTAEERFSDTEHILSCFLKANYSQLYPKKL